MRIYIASSFKNLPIVHSLRDVLRMMGHEVLDFSVYAPPLPVEMSAEERKKALDSDASGEIFTFCAESCAYSDVVIYIGQSGQDVGCEIGIAYGAGVPILGLAGNNEKPGLMLNGCIAGWVADIPALLQKIDGLVL